MEKENLYDALLAMLGDVEFQDDKIIINLKKAKEDNSDKDKINQLSDETFTAICEELGHEKVKELSDNDDYKAFIDYAKEWIDNKIDKLQEELLMLNNED